MKIVKRTLADGTVKEYRYEGHRRRGKRPLPASLGALIQEYRASPQFATLRPATKKTYLRAMGHMEPLYNSAIAAIRRRHVIKLRNRFAKTPALADQLRAVFSVLMVYAIEMEYREGNPAAKIKNIAEGEHQRWTDEQVAFACKTMPERYRRAIILALYTGQRQSDVLRMRWSDYDGEGIFVAQEKTGAKLWICCHPTLRAELERWKAKRTAVTILTDSRGRPYAVPTFATAFSRERRQHPELAGIVFHGLRKTAAAKLAEAGCSSFEVAAITGHKTLGMIEHYTRQADQKRRSRAAILKLETAERQTATNGSEAADFKGS